MEEYRSNSHKSKEREEEKASKKIVVPVVTGVTKQKEKSGFRKFIEKFIAEDATNVKSYIIGDVLIPAIKKAIDDIVSNGIHMLIYGDSATAKKSNVSKISYRNYYDRNEDPRDYSVRSRNAFDYEDIIFSNRGDAESVLTAMEDIIDQFGVVSVGDLYDLADISTTNYTVNKYGWTNIRSAQVVRGRDGYLLKLPRAMPIN